MIDWQVKMNGATPQGWDPERDGCSFPDEDHQEYLLLLFSVGDAPLDPYGDSELKGEGLVRLRGHLETYRRGFEARPDEWTVTEVSGSQRTTLKLRREQVLKVIDRTIEMIDYATGVGGTIEFRGD